MSQNKIRTRLTIFFPPLPSSLRIPFSSALSSTPVLPFFLPSPPLPAAPLLSPSLQMLERHKIVVVVVAYPAFVLFLPFSLSFVPRSDPFSSAVRRSSPLA
jgi:hypothetical protein